LVSRSGRREQHATGAKRHEARQAAITAGELGMALAGGERPLDLARHLD
jgi:hypothetical protein